MKKTHAMDRHLVSHQDFEIDYICQKFSVTRDNVREAIEKVGHSRRKVYAYIRENFNAPVYDDDNANR